MANTKQRQALAVSARLSTQVTQGNGSREIQSVTAGALSALNEEAARIDASEAAKRSGAGTSGHIVIDAGRLSGFVRDDHTTVRFAGGSVAVTTRG